MRKWRSEKKPMAFSLSSTDPATSTYRNARRENALLKDHQLDEPLQPLMMETGGVSSSFPQTLGDMFGASGTLRFSGVVQFYWALF